MKNRTIFVTFIVICTVGLVACNNKKEIKYVEVEKVKTLECDQQEDYSIADNRVVQMREVVFERVEQRVVRLDCDDNIVSDKIEKLPVNKKMDIKISSERKVRGDAKKVIKKLNNISGSAFNRQTCDSGKRDLFTFFAGGFMIDIFESMFRDISNKLSEFQKEELKYNKPTIKLTIDYAPTALTTEVNKGVQLIDYKFERNCEVEPTKAKSQSTVFPNKKKKQKKRKCEKLFEEGTVVLAVKYEDVKLKNTNYIEDSQCK